MMNRKTQFNSEFFLNEVLKSEPEYSLPDNFADMVTNKVSRRFAWESYFKEFLIYLGVIAGILATAVLTVFLWYTPDWKVWGNFLLANISWVAGINILVIFVLFADRVLLRYLFYKKSIKSV